MIIKTARGEYKVEFIKSSWVGVYTIGVFKKHCLWGWTLAYSDDKYAWGEIAAKDMEPAEYARLCRERVEWYEYEKFDKWTGGDPVTMRSPGDTVEWSHG